MDFTNYLKYPKWGWIFQCGEIDDTQNMFPNETYENSTILVQFINAMTNFYSITMHLYWREQCCILLAKRCLRYDHSIWNSISIHVWRVRCMSWYVNQCLPSDIKMSRSPTQKKIFYIIRVNFQFYSGVLNAFVNMC